MLVVDGGWLISFKAGAYVHSVRQFVADFRRSDSYKSPSRSILRRVRLLVARMSRVVDLVETGKFSGRFDQHGLVGACYMPESE